AELQAEWESAQNSSGKIGDADLSDRNRHFEGSNVKARSATLCRVCATRDQSTDKSGGLTTCPFRVINGTRAISRHTSVIDRIADSVLILIGTSTCRSTQSWGSRATWTLSMVKMMTRKRHTVIALTRTSAVLRFSDGAHAKQVGPLRANNGLS